MVGTATSSSFEGEPPSMTADRRKPTHLREPTHFREESLLAAYHPARMRLVVLLRTPAASRIIGEGCE
jgi:hypothetical protein